MQYKPLISIVTVCYNSEIYLKDALNSVLDQNYENIEHIIIDGCSTDSTIEIIKEYESKYEGRLRWISEKDTGIYNALNKGIAMANGEIIGILHSDDWYCSDAINSLINNYEEDIDIYYGDIKKIREINSEKFYQKISGNKLSNITKRMSVPHPSCFVSSKWYNILKYDEKYKISGDYKFILESYLKKAQFKYINSIMACMRMGGTSSGSFMSHLESFKLKHELLRERRYKDLFLGLTSLFLKIIRKKIAFKLLKEDAINFYKSRNWNKIQ